MFLWLSDSHGECTFRNIQSVDWHTDQRPKGKVCMYHIWYRLLKNPIALHLRDSCVHKSNWLTPHSTYSFVYDWANLIMHVLVHVCTISLLLSTKSVGWCINDIHKKIIVFKPRCSSPMHGLVFLTPTPQLCFQLLFGNFSIAQDSHNFFFDLICKIHHAHLYHYIWLL